MQGCCLVVDETWNKDHGKLMGISEAKPFGDIFLFTQAWCAKLTVICIGGRMQLFGRIIKECANWPEHYCYHIFF